MSSLLEADFPQTWNIIIIHHYVDAGSADIF